MPAVVTLITDVKIRNTTCYSLPLSRLNFNFFITFDLQTGGGTMTNISLRLEDLVMPITSTIHSLKSNKALSESLSFFCWEGRFCVLLMCKCVRFEIMNQRWIILDLTRIQKRAESLLSSLNNIVPKRFREKLKTISCMLLRKYPGYNGNKTIKVCLARVNHVLFLPTRWESKFLMKQ